MGEHIEPPFWAKTEADSDAEQAYGRGVQKKLPLWLVAQQSEWTQFIDARIDVLRWRTASGSDRKSAPVYEVKLRRIVQEHFQEWCKIRGYREKHYMKGMDPSLWSLETWAHKFDRYLGPIPSNCRVTISMNVEDPPLVSPRTLSMPNPPLGGDCIYFKDERVLISFQQKLLCKERPAPISPSSTLNYWVALIQGAERGILVLLSTEKSLGREVLAAGGLAKIWCNGAETTIMLQVPAALLDSEWQELPYVIAHCRAIGRLFPAFRSTFATRGPGQNQGSAPPVKTAFD